MDLTSPPLPAGHAVPEEAAGAGVILIDSDLAVRRDLQVMLELGEAEPEPAQRWPPLAAAPAAAVAAHWAALPLLLAQQRRHWLSTWPPQRAALAFRRCPLCTAVQATGTRCLAARR